MTLCRLLASFWSHRHCLSPDSALSRPSSYESRIALCCSCGWNLPSSEHPFLYILGGTALTSVQQMWLVPLADPAFSWLWKVGSLGVRSSPARRCLGGMHFALSPGVAQSHDCGGHHKRPSLTSRGIDSGFIQTPVFPLAAGAESSHWSYRERGFQYL